MESRHSTLCESGPGGRGRRRPGGVGRWRGGRFRRRLRRRCRRRFGGRLRRGLGDRLRRDLRRGLRRRFGSGLGRPFAADRPGGRNDADGDEGRCPCRFRSASCGFHADVLPCMFALPIAVELVRTAGRPRYPTRGGRQMSIASAGGPSPVWREPQRRGSHRGSCSASDGPRRTLEVAGKGEFTAGGLEPARRCRVDAWAAC